MAGAGKSAPGRITFRVDDPETDRALRGLDDRLRHLERAPAIQGVLARAVSFPSTVTVVVYHGLDRAEVTPFISASVDGASGTGRFEVQWSNTSDITNPDVRNNVLIRATGFGATIVADVWFM